MSLKEDVEERIKHLKRAKWSDFKVGDIVDDVMKSQNIPYSKRTETILKLNEILTELVKEGKIKIMGVEERVCGIEDAGRVFQ